MASKKIKSLNSQAKSIKSEAGRLLKKEGDIGANFITDNLSDIESRYNNTMRQLQNTYDIAKNFKADTASYRSSLTEGLTVKDKTNLRQGVHDPVNLSTITMKALQRMGQQGQERLQIWNDYVKERDAN